MRIDLTNNRLFNVQDILVKEQWSYYLIHSWCVCWGGGNKGVHTFPNDISPKVNVIVRLKFELVYCPLRIIIIIIIIISCISSSIYMCPPSDC